MKVITARNVNDAVAQAIPFLLDEGIPEDSRNGKVIVAPAPVMTVYEKPTERVLFSATRDANPFFHLMESLWMLAGRVDLEFPLFFNKRFESYSDDGVHVHGAYGFRWRNWFGFDQLRAIVEELVKKPNSRRAVLTMWSPSGDLIPTELPDGVKIGGLDSRDVPCNTQAYFDTRGGVLNMTVCNRSNDAIWGAYGANVVHFSVLQEYMAAQIGVPVGVYRQFSNNLHIYTDIFSEDKLVNIAAESARARDRQYTPSYLSAREMAVHPLISVSVATWDVELTTFMSDPGKLVNYTDPFFRNVAQPMYRAWAARKEKLSNGHDWVESMADCDWKYACTAWIARREERKN